MSYNFWPPGDDDYSVAARVKTTIFVLYACAGILFVVSVLYGMSK
jgi:hypothetical protein